MPIFSLLLPSYYVTLYKILFALHNNNESHISLADTVQTEQAGAAAREPGCAKQQWITTSTGQ